MEAIVNERVRQGQTRIAIIVWRCYFKLPYSNYGGEMVKMVDSLLP